MMKTVRVFSWVSPAVVMATAMTAIALIAGCAVDKHSYNYTVNGCSTGQHDFDSKDDYCKALQDEATNNGCAAQKRQETFKADCA